jgi:hypothetical protein
LVQSPWPITAPAPSSASAAAITTGQVVQTRQQLPHHQLDHVVIVELDAVVELGELVLHILPLEEQVLVSDLGVKPG